MEIVKIIHRTTMQISLEDLNRIKNLDYKSFDKKFKVNGLELGKLTIDQYAELAGVWSALADGSTTPEEYLENEVKGTWIPSHEQSYIVLGN